MSKKMRGNIILLTTAFIWGTAFVAQSVSMEHIRPFTFNAIRMLLAGIALLAVVAVMQLRRPKPAAAPTSQEAKAGRRTLVFGGIACGVALFLGSAFQQFGVSYTTAGKAGFITALYIVLVPILGLFIKKRVSKIIWLCVAIATGGLYLLCMGESMSLNIGDGLVMLCALFFAVHILVIDYFSPKVDGVKMSCIQFFVCSGICFVLMLIFETPVWADIKAAWLPIIYAGVISGGAGYTLQIIAQKDTDPAVASLILSLESVFAVLAGGLLLDERLTAKEAVGCLLMFAAIILAQLPDKKSANGGSR